MAILKIINAIMAKCKLFAKVWVIAEKSNCFTEKYLRLFKTFQKVSQSQLCRVDKAGVMKWETGVINPICSKYVCWVTVAHSFNNNKILRPARNPPFVSPIDNPRSMQYQVGCYKQNHPMHIRKDLQNLERDIYKREPL